jgi:hypothetical protein
MHVLWLQLLSFLLYNCECKDLLVSVELARILEGQVPHLQPLLELSGLLFLKLKHLHGFIESL